MERNGGGGGGGGAAAAVGGGGGVGSGGSGGVQLIGDHVKHISVGRVASAELSAVGFQRDDIDINILSPAKVPVLYR